MASISPKVYAQGSTEPPATPNVLRLYGNRFCPYVQRVRLVLAAKDIPYETVNIHLKNKPDWYLAKYSSGKVPLLQWNDKRLTESLIISDYLDERQPEPKLWTQDPYEKAVGRIIIDNFGKVSEYLTKIRENQDKSSYDALSVEVKRVNRYLQQKQTPYLSGQKPGMIDYMVWPFVDSLSNFRHSSLNKHSQEPLDKEEYRQFTDWATSMREDPTVIKCSIPTEIRKEFFESYMAGNINYDLGL